MLFFTNLTLKRGQSVLLENTSVAINPGQKVGLVGKNGCGKSSLLALLKKEINAEGGDTSVFLPIGRYLGSIKKRLP